ncbi:hypothetical protein [Butyrivibrio sp. AC2005]|uniref:hypothetical protein n=1 Tax=Butyrivibrio sp. AC2005 TaxID=1280672 RepID=UPI00041D00E4|nr:hypothetical protein [Butyrivibrio sp. AC2005]
MKHTGDLKKQVENARSYEEAKNDIKKTGMLLGDDELDMVAGGGLQEKLKKLEQEAMEDKNGELFHAEHATL